MFRKNTVEGGTRTKVTDVHRESSPLFPVQSVVNEFIENLS
jgi:hypothetical protein